MSIPTDSSRQLLQLLVDLARELPPATLSALTSALESGAGSQNLGRFAATPTMREKLGRLEELCGLQSEISTWGIAVALRAAAEAATAVGVDQRAEIAWTGPATEAV